MKDYNIAPLPKSAQDQIPPKTRSVSKSPLFQKLSTIKVNEAFVVSNDGNEDHDAFVKRVSPNIYATARRAGVSVSLRRLPEGVGVWRVRKKATNEASTTTATQTTAKRGPGRPRKNATAADGAVKRGPGRPRKNETVARAANG